MNQSASHLPPTTIDPVKLHQAMEAAFNDSELQTLCFELEVDYEKDLPPGNTRTKMQGLVNFMERQRRLPELVEKVIAYRPQLAAYNFSRDVPADGSPYKGMHYFDVADADNFFGRETLTAKLVAHLHQHRFLAVVGASGSGKSSVVRAGLIPALKRGFPLADGTTTPEGSHHWPVHIISPGAKPLESLAVSLTEASESVTATATFIDDLGQDARSLHLFVRKQVKQVGSLPPRLLIVVDQFEELFTLCRHEAEQRAFVDNLVYAASEDATAPTIVVLTIRADFYNHCLAYPQLHALLEQRQKIVGRMQPMELREAIEAPARRAGLTFEAGLVELLLRDVGEEPGALPLLSHALLETWKRHEGGWLTLAGYQAAGGVQGAIAKTADDTFNNLSDNEQAIARHIFLRLTELGEGTQDTRRRATLAELIPQEESVTAIEAVITVLTDARLVTIEHDSIEVAHEALIREWPRLRAWVEAGREGLRIHRQLAEAAQAWQLHEPDESYLYRGGRLAQAQEWAKTNRPQLNQLEDAFLAASQNALEQEAVEQERQRQRELETAQRLAAEAEARRQAETARADLQTRATRRTRRMLAGLSLITMVAVGAAIFAFWQVRIAQARDLATQAQNAYNDQNFTLATLLALQSDKLFTTPENSQLLSRIPYSGISAGKALQRHSDDVWSVAWSTDGRLASGAFDNTIIIWDLASGQPAQTLQGHSGEVTSVAWSTDGRLASGAFDNTIIIWDLASGQPAQTLQGHSGEVTSVAWSTDGRLASGGADGVIIWDLAQGQPAQTLQGHSGEVTSVAWSTDGRLASGGVEGVIIWDLAQGQPAKTLQGQSGNVWSVAWSTDGRLASGSWDGKVIIWDLAQGQPAQTFQAQPAQTLQGQLSGLTNVAWSTDGRLASGSGDGKVIIWDLAQGQPAQTLQGHSGNVWSVAWSADGQLASGGAEDVITWDLARGQLAQTMQGQSSGVTNVAWSTDGRLASGSWDDKVIIWDLAQGQPAQTLQGHSRSIASVSWSADGRLASGGAEDVIIWDLASGQPAQTLQGHSGEVTSVAWSTDGRLASGSGDGKVIIWDLAQGQPAQTLQGHSGVVYSVAWSADDRLASGGADGVIIWDLAQGQPAQTLQRHSGVVYSVAWSTDGRLASTSSIDGTVIIWDLAQGQPAQTLQGHSSGVAKVAWSADGRLASASSLDGTVIIWDLAQGQPAQTLQGHSDVVWSVAWSTDGRLASGGGDGTVKVLAEALTHPPCHWLLRNFSEAEWLHYMGTSWIYRPLCPNLPQPIILNPLLTWQGRVLYSGVLVFLGGLLCLVIWELRRAVRRIRPNKP